MRTRRRAGRRHAIEMFHWRPGFDDPVWAGDCAVLAPFASALGAEPHARGQALDAGRGLRTGQLDRRGVQAASWAAESAC